MNITSLRLTAAFAIAMAVLLTGCKSRYNNPPPTPTGEEMDITSIVGEEELDLSMTGIPFDQSKTKAADVNAGPIYFGYDSYVLPPSEISKIQNVADILNRDNSLVMIIEGHCDDRGSNEYNLSLGEQRALAVRDYIVQLGINADRIQSRSFGEEKPAVSGSGENVWRLNRRGEFAFYR